MKKQSLKSCLILLLLTSTASGEIQVIKSDMHRDGGTVCVKYKRNTQVIDCCIDHREKVGTGKVFVGGHPSNKAARIATREEIEKIYSDLNSMPKAERKKLMVERAIKEIHEKLKE